MVRPSLRLVGLAGLCAIGCDSMSFTPPRPPELSSPVAASRPIVDAAAPLGMRSVDVVLAPRGNEDIDYLRTAARVQSGLDKVRARVIEIPAPADGAEDAEAAWVARAEAINKAAAENPLAIVVEAPADPVAKLSEAAAAARGRGVVVVALGRPLGGEKPAAESASTAREILVTPEPLSWSADILVADAIRNAKNGGLDPQNGALLFINSTSDPLVQDRVDALREALKAKGIEAIEELRFAGPADHGREKLNERLKAEPKFALLFATDFVGINIADKLFEPHRETHPYVMAGYSADENHARNQTLVGQFAAVGIYSADRMLRKGINIAAAVAAGRGAEVRDRVEIRVAMFESAPNSALPPPLLKQGPEGAGGPEPEQAKTETKD